MVENQDIVQGAITKTKLSKNLRLDLTNLPQGTVGQIPIIQSDGNWGLVGLSGDISISADGTTTVLNNAEITAADIDTAFNFIHNENGYVVRSPQREGQTTVYEVDNSTYVTEVVAAAHAEHAVSTSAVKTYTTIITGDGIVHGSTQIYMVTHNLGTQYVFVSVRSPIGDGGGTAAEKFTNESYIHMDVGYASSAPGIMVGTFDLSGNLSDNHVTLEFPSTSAIAEGTEYLVTVIGIIGG